MAQNQHKTQMKLKQITAQIKAASSGKPSDEQMALIQPYLIGEIPAEDLYVRSMVLAHNGIDRDRESLSPDLLSDLAETLVGKGLHIRHPMGLDGDTGPGEGRFFAAELITMSLDQARQALGDPQLRFLPGVTEAVLLEASFYTVKTTDNAALLKKIDAGIARDVSIGFRSSNYKRIGQPDNDETLLAYELQPPGEAYEGSLVWLGAQPGAGITKHAKTEDIDMDQEELDKLKKAAADAKAEYAVIEKALGADALADLDNTKSLIADGKAYRADLIQSVIKAKRLAGELGDSDEDSAEATAFYASMPLKMLQKEQQARQKSLGSTQQIQGADPNGQGESDQPKGLRDASITAKALGQ